MILRLLTVFYLACFCACAVPGIVRIVRRRSSRDCSVWREWLLLAGIAAQFAVMVLTGASVYVWISPLASACSIGTLLLVIYHYRG